MKLGFQSITKKERDKIRNKWKREKYNTQKAMTDYKPRGYECIICGFYTINCRAMTDHHSNNFTDKAENCRIKIIKIQK